MYIYIYIYIYIRPPCFAGLRACEIPVLICDTDTVNVQVECSEFQEGANACPGAASPHQNPVPKTTAFSTIQHPLAPRSEVLGGASGVPWGASGVPLPFRCPPLIRFRATEGILSTSSHSSILALRIGTESPERVLALRATCTEYTSFGSGRLKEH